MINFPVIHWKRPDPHTWTLRATPAGGGFSCICWAPEISTFVALGYYQSDIAITSTDGENWTSHSTPALGGGSQQWEAIAWSPSLRLFAAVGNTTNGYRILTSPNGAAWTAIPENASPYNSWSAIAWAAELGKFVVIGVLGTVMSSADGVTWANEDISGGDTPSGYGLTWNGALFVCMSEFGVVFTSPDGGTWTSQAAGLDAVVIRNPAWNGSVFCGVLFGGTDGGQAVTSTNGVTWVIRTTPAGVGISWSGITWDGAQFVAIGYDISGVSYTMTSPTGILWTLHTAVAFPNVSGIAWAPFLELFAAVRLDTTLIGTQNVMTSSTGL